MSHTAKRLTVSILILIALLMVAIIWRYELREQARKKREDACELARRRYSAALRLGMTRKEVQEYFRENNVVTLWRSPDELLVKIGQEDPPWFCNDLNVYVEFQLDHTGTNSAQWTPNDSDVLTAITIVHRPDRCL